MSYNFTQGREPKENFFNESGEGVIKEGKVYFKGTYWKIASHEEFQENEKVQVIKVEGSTAIIKKLR